MDNLNKKIPKRKKLFENFFVLGIENENLDFIEEKELLLTPKILYTHQQDKSYNILINYYRNCCYKDGVKVTRNEIYSEIDYSTKILEENFFANPISTFIFIKALYIKMHTTFPILIINHIIAISYFIDNIYN